MLVYRINFANPAADRYSRLALWQVRKTKQELDSAFRSLGIGELTDMRVLQRGASERPIGTEIIGTAGRATVPALRLRTLLALRDSLMSYDIERNAAGAVVGATFFGRGCVAPAMDSMPSRAARRIWRMRHGGTGCRARNTVCPAASGTICSVA
jgi:hypothetical protein